MLGNAFVEPVVSLDLNLAVATADLVSAEDLLGRHFRVGRFRSGSTSRCPGQTYGCSSRRTHGYGAFVGGVSERDVLGLKLPVATPEDVLSTAITA